MAMGRLNRPALMVYGGTIKPGDIGRWLSRSTSCPAFQSYGEFLAGNIDDDERLDIVRNACPGAGACGGMYTANTMASAIEAMGMTLPYSSSTAGRDPAKMAECRRGGARHAAFCSKHEIKPRDIMTRRAFENAMVVVIAAGWFYQRRPASDRHGSQRQCASSPSTTSKR